MRGRIATVVLLWLALIASAHAQWINHPSAGIPRTKDGKPNLSARTPTTADGPEVVNKYFINLLADFKPEDSPLRKEFVPLLVQRGVEGQSKDLPSARYLPTGVPMGDLLALPRRFVQVPGLLVMLSEANPQRLGFNDKTWLDAFGHPRSEAMRITERLRRRDFGHMDVQVTIDDATVYASFRSATQ